jgi:putative CocE/NonD family hydrolase
MKRLLVGLVAVLLAAPVAASSAAPAPAYETVYFPSADGTLLHAEVFRPAVDGPVPVVLLVSPYNNGTSVTVDDRQPGNLHYEPFQALLDRGYAIVQASLRGYNASGGCGDWGGRGEQADAKAAVEWAASQPWSNGKVGMYGISYDGWTQVMALAAKPRGLAAVVAQAPLVDGYRGMWMNGAHYQGTWWLTPTVGYGTTDLKPSNAAHGPAGTATSVGGTATNPHCYASNAVFTAVGDKSIPYWQERDIVAAAAESTVPVLYSQGFRDNSVKSDNFAALYPWLRGPKRAWVGQFGHRAPDHPADAGVRARYYAEALDWFDAYLRDDAAALARVAAAPPAVVQEADGRYRGEDAWPAPDASVSPLRLRSGTYVEDPRDDGMHPRDPGEVLWSVSRPLPYAHPH